VIRLQEACFEPGLEIGRFCAGRKDIGAVATFVGLVRDFHGDQRVSALTLEHYEGMTEKMMAEIEREAQERWALDDVLVIHRYGRMEPGEAIVLVCAASAHRHAALEACAFLIDWLKTKAPFWKLEDTPQGERWVEALSSDDVAAARWDRRAGDQHPSPCADGASGTA
jgi:molybdopterin synthase catalytic subunit